MRCLGVKLTETEYSGDCQGLGEGEMRIYCLMDTGFQFYKMKKSSGMDCCNNAQ